MLDALTAVPRCLTQLCNIGKNEQQLSGRVLLAGNNGCRCLRRTSGLVAQVGWLDVWDWWPQNTAADELATDAMILS